MKIVVIGTRGIPGIPGGVETHCEELYPRIAALGHDVTVMRRSCYITDDNRIDNYKGVNLIDIPTPRRKSLEAIVHTFRAVRRAKKLHPDVVHIHAIGPSLMVPLARMMGLRVVSTNHGPDYDRGKWGRLAKLFLKTGERMGARYSNRVIVISKVIAGILAHKYGRTDTDLIFNGVVRQTKSDKTDYIRSLGLEPGKYVVAVGRFVEEKGFHDLVRAWQQITPAGYKLVIAGDSDHPDHYSENLKAQARQAGAVLTGYIRGEKMNQVMTNAALFVLPSYHEGLPIALLEAMSYDLDVLVSDIPANTIDELDSSDFFHTGDVDDLGRNLARKLSEAKKPRHHDLSRYDWDSIARQTIEVYNKAKRTQKQ